MTILSTVNTRLDDMLRTLEANRAAADQHRHHSNLATVGSFAALLLTSGSKSRTVRTVGTVAAAGGMLYGASQATKAATLESQNMGIMDSCLGTIESEGLRAVRSDPLQDARRRFVELALRLGQHVDAALERHGSRLKGMSMLRKRNRQMMLQAPQVDIVRNKLRMNRIIVGIDRTKSFPDHEGEFRRSVGCINVARLDREALWSVAIIAGAIVLGIVLGQVGQVGAMFFLIAIGFWGWNHWFPVFPQMRALKASVDRLVEGLSGQPVVSSLLLSSVP